MTFICPALYASELKVNVSSLSQFGYIFRPAETKDLINSKEMAITDF